MATLHTRRKRRLRLVIWSLVLLVAHSLRAQEVSIDLPDGGIRFPDGSVQDSALQEYAQVITVAKSGAAFTSIQQALDSIVDASIWKPYLVTVAPGTYSERVTLKEYVTVRGASSFLTAITSPGSDALDTGTVVGARNATILDLRVACEGEGFAFAVAYFNPGGGQLIERVGLSAKDALTNYGIYNLNGGGLSLRNTGVSALDGQKNYGVFNRFGEPRMHEVRVNVYDQYEGVSYGVFNERAEPLMTDVEIDCMWSHTCYGIYNNNWSRARIYDSRIELGGFAPIAYGVFNQDSISILRGVALEVLNTSQGFGLASQGLSHAAVHNSSVRALTHPLIGTGIKVAYSQLVGPENADLPDGTCLGAYNGGFLPLSSRCRLEDPAAN